MTLRKRLTVRTHAADFLRQILQHILPKGFQRARNDGFQHPNKKRLIGLLQIVLRVKPRPPFAEAKPRPRSA